MHNNNKDYKPHECQEHFRLFSYLAMAIVTIAIFVGLFIIIQHLSEEAANAKVAANQETLLENQQLLLGLTRNQTDNQVIADTILNETRRDNAAFFKILSDISIEHATSTSKIMNQAVEIANESNKELDQILEQGIKIDSEANKKIDTIIEYLGTKK